MKLPNKKLTIQKIPLSALIEILENLYNDGVEYIDISGELKEDKDVIKITVKEEYMTLDEDHDESEHKFEEIFDKRDDDDDDQEDILDKEPTRSVKKLTDEDITNLL